MTDLSKHAPQRVGVFVDVQNLYYSAKNLYNSKVDFGKVLKTATAERQLIRAIAYVIRADIEPEQAFYEALRKQGFEVRAKDLQIFPGGAKKGDWDVGICVDMIRTAPLLDVEILVSGDGDYTDLLRYLKAGQGQRVEVVAFGRTTSGRLVDEADDFLDLDKFTNRFLIKPSLSREKSH